MTAQARRIVATACLAGVALLAAACGGGPATVPIKDHVQIRPVLADDPLAARVRTADGGILGVGDVLLTEKSLGRVQVLQKPDGRYDVLLTVTGVDGARWKEYVEKYRRKTPEAALILDGTVFCRFPITVPDEEKEGAVIAVPNAGATDEDAGRLRRAFGLEARDK